MSPMPLGLSVQGLGSASELAVFGGTPAFAEPLHVGRPHIGDRARFGELLEGVLDRRWLTNDGPLVSELEERVADHVGVKHCVAMCNGTVALEIAIRALGLTGEVIVPSYTFIATAHALHWQGLTPVFSDIDPRTHTLDPEAVRRAVTPRTTGIIGVHLWGRGADVAALQAVADEHGLELMFDAAHAFGCTHGQRMIGGFGRAEVLSFHATKFFHSFEGGAVVTDDDGLAAEMRLIRNFGFAGEDTVAHSGTNGKMTEVCAAMGLANLPRLDRVLETNRANHAAYTHSLRGLPGVEVMPYDETERNNYHYVVLAIDRSAGVSRDDLWRTLQAENVLARRYFWPACHRMLPYRDLFPRAGLSLPHTETVADQVLVLPTGDSVSPDDIEVIASILEKRIAIG
jgi:dTDP-4-amino-4,6-dideoxygalactose transaminase